MNWILIKLRNCILIILILRVLNNNQIIFEINVKNDFKKKNNVDKINKMDFYLSYKENDDYQTRKTENMTSNID